MTAKVRSALTNTFVHYIDGETTVIGLNSAFAQVAATINTIIQRVIDNGYNMRLMEMRQIQNIGESIEVFNENVTTINEFLLSLSSLIGEDYLISKELLETMDISFINNNTSGAVRVQPAALSITLGNGQVISVTEGSVTSTLGAEELVSTHA